MKMLLKALCLILAVCSLIVICVACEQKPIDDKAYYDYINSDTGSGEHIRTKFVEREINSMKTEDFVSTDKQSDYVLIKVKNYGDIVVLLSDGVSSDTEDAPWLIELLGTEREGESLAKLGARILETAKNKVGTADDMSVLLVKIKSLAVSKNAASE